jgi:hypothetical protein
MRSCTLIFLLISVSSFGQGSVIDQREKERLEIENLVKASGDRLTVLVQVGGQTGLKKVINQGWPDGIETTYNILQNSSGQIIYLGEFPTCESGDWSLGLKHYFADTGKLISFEKTLSYFNSECTDGAVVETIIELYDSDFKVIKSTKTQTDHKGKSLKVTNCEHAYDWTFDKRGTVDELIRLKKIVL